MPPPRILGVDFTSAPSRRKPITCATGRFANAATLDIEDVERIESFADYEALLRRPGPWIGGFDHPFGQPIALLDLLGLPHRWADYVRAMEGWRRDGFERRVRALQAKQLPGAKEWHRVGDALAGASAPHKTANPPVGWMFVEGASRLLGAGVTLPPVHH